jgi:hypothetical protein
LIFFIVTPAAGRSATCPWRARQRAPAMADVGRAAPNCHRKS